MNFAGETIAADLRLIGVQHPADLLGADALALYRRLCTLTGKRHDPCVLDTFMAATDFMSGAEPRPWWAYTAQRKATFGAV